ncbi:MAG: glutamine synthetase [Firmicutes bacterium]|nr:glutamine synthetase [Bacillota bacterium]
MYEKMIFSIPAAMHNAKDLRAVFAAHPELRFVSLVGLDIYGRDTDEKIPAEELLKDPEGFIRKGVQTDGSSVLLPGIADISNAKVDMIPDPDVNWYVDYNLRNIDDETGLPVGTVRIPAYLVHNDVNSVGSRIILEKAVDRFKKELPRLIAENPYILEDLPFDSADDIEEITLTAATELEFYVKTPHNVADREKMHTSQELKEQYWKRTMGPVRTALEQTIRLLNCYGFEVEMGHKEVGGIQSELMKGGDFDHIMEQLEIDWRFTDPMQAADNDNIIRYIVRDVFRNNGLDVSFMAKPVEDVAGSGKHTHMGAAARLRDGRLVNLFSTLRPETEYMNPIGFGALMGILRNYEIMNPMINCTNDAFGRLKPGYEAPICIACSLGRSVSFPSRNRSVLIGLIRSAGSPMATHFELRSPNPKSNTYLVLASGLMAMLDGIRAALTAHKTSADLERSVSKPYGAEDFYLEKDRIYRAENNIFKDYGPEERERYFGKAPATVWENLSAFDSCPEKLSVLTDGGVMTMQDIASYKAAATDQWEMELHDRIVPSLVARARACVKVHEEGSDLDQLRWANISKEIGLLAKDSLSFTSLLTELNRSIESGDFDKASELQTEAQERVNALEKNYSEYLRNIV